jgi:hypothetical protein
LNGETSIDTTIEPQVTEVDLIEPLRRLTKDLKVAAQLLSPQEVRYLVDLYYQIQENRKRSANQVLIVEGQEPNLLLSFFADSTKLLERNIRTAMAEFSKAKRIGRWAEANVGIGPVISAGLIAHIDMTRSTNVSKLWSFAGLNPTAKWVKGEKRPWNARLKVLCWKIGDSFCKFHNKKECYYGHLYAERKSLEVARNEAGAFREAARLTLVERKIKDPKTRSCYEGGKLPDGRLELRARRYAVKRFLSHWWYVAYTIEMGNRPPQPWIVEHGGHTDVTLPPNWPID